VPLTLGALAVVVATAAGGIATASDDTSQAGDIGPVSSLFIFMFFATADASSVESGSDSGDFSSEVTPGPAVTGSEFGSDFEVQSALRQVGVAEETYHAEHGVYTGVEIELNTSVPASVVIVFADASRYCAVGYSDSGHSYMLDSDIGSVVAGATC
jgi:hypothetical protein